jgi:beta-xylosidase
MYGFLTVFFLYVSALGGYLTDQQEYFDHQKEKGRKDTHTAIPLNSHAQKKIKNNPIEFYIVATIRIM